MKRALIKDSVAIGKCPCCVAVFDHLGDWNLASIVAEYAHQFSLETYQEMIDARFGTSGDTDEYGNQKYGCIIGDIRVGPEYLDPPIACVDFWEGPTMRLMHMQVHAGLNIVNIHLAGMHNNSIVKRICAETAQCSWYESIIKHFCPANRQRTWDALKTGQAEMPPEFRGMCDFMLCTIDTWIHEKSRVLVCQYAMQKMPPGHYAPPHANAIV